MVETRRAIVPNTALEPKRRRRAKTATWSTPGALSFGAGLEAITRSSSLLSERVTELAQDVQFTVATTTRSGEPIENQMGRLTIGNLKEFQPRPDAQQEAIDKLEREGCKLIRRGRFGVTMSGPADLVANLIGGNLVVQARARRSPLASTQMFATDFELPLAHDLFLAPETSLSVATDVAPSIDHLVFMPPPIYFALPSPDAPAHDFHAVDEARIRQVLNVPAGASAAGVRVALVDTGFYPHPYYAQRGLRLRPMPTASAPNPQVDNYGHGTAIAYNVFAVAPDVEVLGFQQTNPPQDALEDAADANVDVISCSWGYDREQMPSVLRASLLSIIEEGKIVLFAAGNGHYAWPGSEPDVLSIGGVYWNAAGGLEASDYASGYMSSMFPGRRVPDVSGLCGQRPKAIYIMMPTQAGNTMDTGNGGVAFPHGDGSAPDDGWVGASGTSSATPQIAGVVALMVAKARSLGRPLTAATVKSILEQSCVAVTAGRNAMGFPAVGQPNTAVGFGLVDATAALSRV